MAEHRVAGGGDDLIRAAGVLGLAHAALAPAVSDSAYRVLVGEDGSAALLRRQWTADGVAEAVLLAASGVGPATPAVRSVAAGWGCARVRDLPGGQGVVAVGPPEDTSVATRFRYLAALAATRVETAVALARGAGEDRVKPDGSPSIAADEAAHVAAAQVLGELGVPVLSEERRDVAVDDDRPWVVLDPLDGTGNFVAGLPPWAFSAGLVHRGRPIAGLVADLSSGRRWEAAEGAGAWRDGVPVRPRAGTTVVVPSGPLVRVPRDAYRVRVTGCTAVELCLVADGSASAWHNIDRRGTHVHDIAGGLAVLLAGGGVALAADGSPLHLHPDTGRLIRLAAASSDPAARTLLDVGEG